MALPTRALYHPEAPDLNLQNIFVLHLKQKKDCVTVCSTLDYVQLTLALSWRDPQYHHETPFLQVQIIYVPSPIAIWNLCATALQ